MGIFEDISGALSKGMEGAGRIADTASLKFKLGEAERRRRDLAADLGESLYSTISNGGELPAGCERIIVDMKACDAEIAQIKADIDRLAREMEDAKTTSVSYSCPNCGATFTEGARFCHVCGTPAPVSASAQEVEVGEAPRPQQPESVSGGECACEAAPIEVESVRADAAVEGETQSYEVPSRQQ